MNLDFDLRAFGAPAALPGPSLPDAARRGAVRAAKRSIPTRRLSRLSSQAAFNDAASPPFKQEIRQ